MHLAEWIPGQLIPEDKSCVTSLLGNVNSSRVYEVLQNVDNGSRLSWAPWDLYHPPLQGMVAGSSKFYVARKRVTGQEDNEVSSQLDGAVRSLKGYTHYVGKFNPEQYGRISVITEVRKIWYTWYTLILVIFGLWLPHLCLVSFQFIGL